MVYLGDVFNKKGSNINLVADRVSRGSGIIVKAVSICEEMAMSKYAIMTMILLYNSIFLSSIIYNCQAWTWLMSDDIQKLKTIQVKYLKRALQTSISTPNVLVYLELGVLPIEYEIDIRRLTFLQHILCLGEEDPVRKVYTEQHHYKEEKNWHNEIEKKNLWH